MTFRIEIFRDGEWVEYASGVKHEDVIKIYGSWILDKDSPIRAILEK